MERDDDDAGIERQVGDVLAAVAPTLDGESYKGQGGRIGVLGGSIDYTGAPYYAAASALVVGAELASIYTAQEACIPIKGYSPELMVSAVYTHAEIHSPEAQHRMVTKVTEALPRLHCLAIGPGLGRDDGVLSAVANIISAAKKIDLPLVIDADGLWLVNQKPELVRGYGAAVLTPNAMEYRRLACAVLGTDRGDASVHELCVALDGPTIIQKGKVDRICTLMSSEPLQCTLNGSPKRPGGLGDILAGTLAVVLAWSRTRGQPIAPACHAACSIVRLACRAAFSKHRRGMVAPNVLDELPIVFERLCPAIAKEI